MTKDKPPTQYLPRITEGPGCNVGADRAIFAPTSKIVMKVRGLPSTERNPGLLCCSYDGGTGEVRKCGKPQASHDLE